MTCGCDGFSGELVGEEAAERIATLRLVPHDPREQGPKEEYLCDTCGTWWTADFPFHTWAADGRGERHLRPSESIGGGRPLNAMP